MSKLVIVLFTVLTVVATNASRTPEELWNRRQMAEKDIDEAQSYIVRKYDDAVKQHDNLKNNIKDLGVEWVANANDHIVALINDARLEIEDLKEGVELLDDEACLHHAIHLADKTEEASTNLTNCVSNKTKVSTDNEFDFITDAKRASLYRAANSRDELNSCMDDNKSDSDEAMNCLADVHIKSLGIRDAIDTATSRHMTRISEEFESAAQSLDLCETEYGVPNYYKFTTSIVNKVAKCFATGKHARYIREVPPTWLQTNGQRLPNSASISNRGHKNLDETHDKDDLLAQE